MPMSLAGFLLGQKQASCVFRRQMTRPRAMLAKSVGSVRDFPAKTRGCSREGSFGESA